MFLRQLLSVVQKAFSSIFIYGEVTAAMKETHRAKALIKRFSEQRKMAIGILLALLAYTAHQGKTTSAENIVGCLLFSCNICLIYDGISEETFKVCAGALGPLTFSLINLFPFILANFALFIELLPVIESKAQHNCNVTTTPATGSEPSGRRLCFGLGRGGLMKKHDSASLECGDGGNGVPSEPQLYLSYISARVSSNYSVENVYRSASAELFRLAKKETGGCDLHVLASTSFILMSKRKTRHDYSTSSKRSSYTPSALLEPPTPESDPALFIQAHEANIIRGACAGEATQALAVDNASNRSEKHGDALIRWDPQENANSVGKEAAERGIWLDRYDVRLLLESLPPSPPAGASNHGWQSPGGWSDLESDTEDAEDALHYSEEMDDAEREKKRRHIEELHEKRVQAIRARDGEDDGAESPSVVDQWGGSDEEPDDAQREFMKKTAAHILSSPNPTQLEMRILANHGNDPRFTFLRGRWKNSWEAEKRKVREETQKEERHVSGVALGGLVGYGDSDEESE